MAARYNPIIRDSAIEPGDAFAAGDLAHRLRLPLRQGPIRFGALLAFALCASPAARADSDATTVAQIQFDDDLLMKPQGRSIDVSRFERGQLVAPGAYRVDLYRNGDALGRVEVQFNAPEEGASAVPCLNLSVVKRLGLDMKTVTQQSPDLLATLDEGQCVSVDRLFPDATGSFDFPNLRLDLNIAQIALERNPDGYVSPELWDSGVPSATLAYNLNGFHTSAGATSNNQLYLGLTGGVNLGDWHFRTTGALNDATYGGTHYQNIATYVARDLPSLRSQLLIGDSFTDGAVFDSIGIQGVQFGTNDQMLPDSMRGYAPLVRGIAMTNARVTIRQNGNIIYATNVPPGPFSIDDVYPVGYGGNLVVTVTEADGSEHSYTVPYASVVQLLRPGISRFNLVAGQVRDATLDTHPTIFQGTYQRGINNFVTGYAGVIAADGYTSGLVGAAFNTPIGAVALDITQANATIARAPHTSGQSVRLSYSKTLQETGTNLSVAAYRYSSRGFWSLRDALLARQFLDRGDIAQIDRQRDQVQVSVNQSLGSNWGNVYLVGSTRSYWNRGGTDTQFQFGYNNALRVRGYSMGYSVQFSRERTALANQMVNQVLATATLPLGRGRQAPLMSLNVGRSNQNGSTGLATVSGSLGDYNQFAYGVNANRAGGVSSGGGQVQYSAQSATVSASGSAGSGYSQVGAGITGALVVHPGGLTLTNSLSDTAGIVEATGAAGAHIENWPGVQIDSRGYAVLPYLRPYHMNTVVLDPKGLPYNIEFGETSQRVAPRGNSIAMLHFDTRHGQSALLTLRQPDGSVVPFGADVTDAKGQTVASVGQGGVLYLRGADEGDRYAVRWGRNASETCGFVMKVSVDADSPYAKSDVVCSDAPEVSEAASVQQTEIQEAVL